MDKGKRSLKKVAPISVVRRVTGWSAVLYGGAVIAWYVAYLLVGDRFWLLGLVNGFAVYLFAPLPVFVPLALLARNRAAGLVLLTVALLFVVLFGGNWVPSLTPTRAADAGSTLTVMTYNVLFTVDEVEPLAANIGRAAPDVIAFQELTPERARRLEQLIGADYPYRTALHPATCHAEVAVWSRYPLQTEPVDEEITCRVRPVLVSWDGSRDPVLVVDVHGWPYTGFSREAVERGFRWRQEQMAWVLDRFGGRPEPLIILGDLNSTPQHRAYRMLAAHLTDSFREAGWGLGHTFPADANYCLVRIDHIFHSDAWRAEAAWVSEWDGVSDHRAVIARLRLLPKSGHSRLTTGR